MTADEPQIPDWDSADWDKGEGYFRHRSGCGDRPGADARIHEP